MKFLIQVSDQAKVEIDGKVVGSIGKGYTVLIGIGQEDTEAVADKMIRKLLSLRIFPDKNGKTNLSLEQVDGALLLISQFTLYADCRHGNRPSFIRAGKPEQAKRLYEYIISECEKKVGQVETGRFGADMKVSLVNSGPFTILLDSEEL